MDKDTNKSFITERRSYERIKCEYSAIVRGISANKKKLEEIVRVLNLSASGAYFLINRNVEVGQKLTIKIGFPTGFLDYGTSKVTKKVAVVRTEIHSEGVLGVAGQFDDYRSL